MQWKRRDTNDDIDWEGGKNKYYNKNLENCYDMAAGEGAARTHTADDVHMRWTIFDENICST